MSNPRFKTFVFIPEKLEYIPEEPRARLAEIVRQVITDEVHNEVLTILDEHAPEDYNLFNLEVFASTSSLIVYKRVINE